MNHFERYRECNHDYETSFPDETNSSGTKYIGFTLGSVLLVCIVVTFWRFRKGLFILQKKQQNYF